MISWRTPVAALALIAMAGCTRESPEARIKKTFEGCVQDLERGNGAAALEILSPSFEGPEGMDRSAAHYYLLALLKQKHLGITVLTSHIDAREQTATQELSVMVTQRGGRSVIPDETSRQDFIIQWERRQGKWLVSSLRQSR